MTLEEMTPQEASDKIASSWEWLLQESSGTSIFLSPGWVRAWWKHFGEGKEAQFLAARDEEGHVVGIAPMYLCRFRAAGLPGPRVLRLMGDEKVGSEYLGFLIRPACEEVFLEALSERLRNVWTLADLMGLREGSTVSERMPSIFGDRAPGRIHRERHPCSLVRLPNDYEVYLASLPQKFRTTLRYRTNKLTKNFMVKLIRTTREEEIEPHLDRLFAMHQARWVAEGHPGSFYDPRMRAFYRDVSSDFLRRGWLRFYHLEVDGIIRASQFGFAFDGIMHSLQESFDHEFHPPGVGGVGVVLRGMAIRECIAEGLSGYDFLGGEEEFKTRWGTVPHYIHRLRIGAPGPTGALAFAATAGVRQIKDWGRARLPGWAFDLRDRWRAWRRTRFARRVARGPREVHG